MNVSFDAQPAANAYSLAFRRLRELPGFDHKAVLRAEAGVILKTWAGRTKVVSRAQADRNARLRALKRVGATSGALTVSINAGIRGPSGYVWHRPAAGQSKRARKQSFRLAGRMNDDGHFVANWLHFSDAGWRDIQDLTAEAQSAINAEREKGRRAVGLARQSVIQIADDLQIDLATVQGGGGLSSSAISKARAAIASNGKAYRNGNGTQAGDDVRAYVDLINRLPYGAAAGMDRTLAGVLSGRAKFIEQSYKKGAFESMRTAARAFPNILTAAGLS